MDSYLIALALLGFVTLLTAWVPMAVRELPLSLPIFCVGFGAVGSQIPGFLDDVPHPLEHRLVFERVTEFIVIIALMGAGLKIDRLFDWRSWLITWRLLGIAMPLTIAGIAFAGWGILGYGLATSLLLGAVLAPTDPVLASDIQVGPPRSGEESQTRFGLTSEAGLNDGLAFPFVHLAIAVALSGAAPQAWLAEWLAIDVAWRIGVGILAGWLIGRALGYVAFRLPDRARLARSSDGFVALGATFLAYGLTELVYGYGFLAVFVAGLALRSVERNHRYHDELHDFAEQTERLSLMLFLVAFGAMLAVAGVFDTLGWAEVLTAFVALFLVRPLAGWLGLVGLAVPARERLVISFFGIRGIGSFYYLAFALGVAEFERPERLMAVVSLTVLASIVIHGVSATPVMRWLEAPRRGR